MISVIRVGCALAITIAGVAGAAAADLELAPPPPAPFRAPPLLIFNWTSCYLGGYGGYAYSDKLVTGTILGPIIGPLLVNVADTRPIGFATNGVLIGGQVGCNYQFAPSWVVGIEVDASWANVDGVGSRQSLAGTFPGLFGLPTTSSSAGTLSIKTDFIATATARLGYTFGSIGQGLIYGKGGAAWIANRDTFSGLLQSTGCIAATNPPPQCTATATLVVPFNWTTRDTRVGWTIGVGIEWAILGKWTIKGEYDYLDFGAKNVTLNDVTLGATTVSVRETVSEVKLGINYRFGVPLVASY
jgi:outer membrane immunogenic protein